MEGRNSEDNDFTPHVPLYDSPMACLTVSVYYYVLFAYIIQFPVQLASIRVYIFGRPLPSNYSCIILSMETTIIKHFVCLTTPMVSSL